MPENDVEVGQHLRHAPRRGRRQSRVGARRCRAVPRPQARVAARLGGHLGRSRDQPPGIIVLWRGLSRLADIELGVKIAERPNCG